MNFTLFQFKVHNVQVQNKVHKVRTSQLCLQLTVICDEVVEHVAQKVFDEDLLSDGVDASKVPAKLETMLLRGVVGGRALENTVARSISTSSSEPAPF